jgi:GntR family transcriptional regulator
MLHVTPVLPFPVTLRPDESPVRQVVFAATKAILSGLLAPGDSFPSVRELSEQLRIHPNSAQKVVTELVRQGLLLTKPGIGTQVQYSRRDAGNGRVDLLDRELDRLVVEARLLGITRAQLRQAVDERWEVVFGRDEKGSVPRAESPRTNSPNSSQPRR